jgi:hypothetical protein
MLPPIQADVTERAANRAFEFALLKP